MSVAIDVHQHLWPQTLLAALARRRRAPLLRRDGERGWILRIDGEPEWPVDPADHDPALRARLLGADGLDLALVALSSPLGIEALPPDEAGGLIAAYHEGVGDLPQGLRAWASAGLAEPDPVALAHQLDGGLVGLCLPAGALSGAEGVERCATLLALLEERGRPLFVHPGSAPWARCAPGGEGMPSWWPALTAYVTQMQAAWLAFRIWARPAHPRLRVCFAMLAGLAPLQAEWLGSRGQDSDARDRHAFYDTSSYGPRAIAAMAAAVGADALVHGSDRPVVSPAAPSAHDHHPTRVGNPSRLLAPQEALA